MKHISLFSLALLYAFSIHAAAGSWEDKMHKAVVPYYHDRLTKMCAEDLKGKQNIDQKRLASAIMVTRNTTWFGGSIPLDSTVKKPFYLTHVLPGITGWEYEISNDDLQTTFADKDTVEKIQTLLGSDSKHVATIFYNEDGKMVDRKKIPNDCAYTRVRNLLNTMPKFTINPKGISDHIVPSSDWTIELADKPVAYLGTMFPQELVLPYRGGVLIMR